VKQSFLLLTDHDTFGGAEVSFYALARALAVKGFGVTLVIPTESPRERPPLERARADGVVVISAGGRLAPGPAGRLGRILRLAPAARVRTALRTSAPDVAIINLPTVERGAAVLDGLQGHRRTGLRIAGYLHLAHRPSILGARFFGWLRDRLAPRHLARFDRLLAASRATAREAQRLYGGPISVVYEACPAVGEEHATVDRETARRLLDLPLEGQVAGVVARVQFRQKQLDVVVRIAARLTSSHPQLRWTIMGDGPDIARLKAQVASVGLDARFRFAGWQPDAHQLMRAFDVLVMTSRFEGMPLVAVEALHAGVPIVAYAVDGLEEILDSRHAVTPGDEAALAAAIIGALASSRIRPVGGEAELVTRSCHPAAVAASVAAAVNQSQVSHR
jgi:glycosyltransferase involved in cell wall biosynthesis